MILSEATPYLFSDDDANYKASRYKKQYVFVLINEFAQIHAVYIISIKISKTSYACKGKQFIAHQLNILISVKSMAPPEKIDGCLFWDDEFLH